MQTTPAIHTRSKRRYSDGDEARAILAAMSAATYNDFVLPVYYAGRVVAWVFGERSPSPVVHCYVRRPGDPETMWTGFTGIDDIIDETTNNGKLLRNQWMKRFNAASPNQVWTHLAGSGGWPTYEAFAGTALTARQFDESSRPAIANGGNKTPDTKHILSITASSTLGNPVFLLYDLVLSYDRCTLTNGSQAMVNVLTAQRYATAGQFGLRIMGVITTVMASACTFTTLTYVTPGGATKTIPNPTAYGVAGGATITGDTIPNGAWWTTPTGTARSQLCLPLAVGDTGIASITDFQMSATPASGEISFLLGYPLAWIPIITADALVTIDTVKQLPQLGRLYDGACPTFALWSNSTGHTQFFGDVVFGWG
jgi:hypothetical protein